LPQQRRQQQRHLQQQQQQQQENGESQTVREDAAGSQAPVSLQLPRQASQFSQFKARF